MNASGQMLPVPALDRKEGGGCAYAKLDSYGLKSSAGASHQLHCRNSFIRERGSVVTFAVHVALLGALVCYIHLVCASKQMVRPNALSVVALVKDAQHGCSKVQEPRSAMRENVPATLRAFSKLAITVRPFECSPNPARTEMRHVLWNRAILVHLCPKSLREGFGKSLSGEERICNGMFSGLHNSALRIVSAFQRDNAAMHEQFQTITA